MELKQNFLASVLQSNGKKKKRNTRWDNMIIYYMKTKEHLLNKKTYTFVLHYIQ